MANTDVQHDVIVIGAGIAGLGGSGFHDYMRNQYDTYGRVIRAAGIKSESSLPPP